MALIVVLDLSYAIAYRDATAHTAQIWLLVLGILWGDIWAWLEDIKARRGGLAIVFVAGKAVALIVALLAMAPAIQIHGWTLLHRSTAGVASVDTVSRLGCWLEANVDADTRIINWSPSPVAISGHRMTAGIEQGFATAVLLWPRFGALTEKPTKFASWPELEERMTSGMVPLVIESPAISPFYMKFSEAYFQKLKERYEKVLRDHYRFIGKIGKFTPYLVYAHRDWQGGQSLAPLPQDRHQESARLVNPARTASILWRDMGTAVARMINADFDKRCPGIQNRR